jgi:hypothetical protein
MLGTLNRTLAAVLSGYAEGTMIRVSEFRPALRQRGDSIARTAQILDAMGILADDRPAAFDQWLAARLGGLAPGISGEASLWAVASHDGTLRTPALHDKRYAGPGTTSSHGSYRQPHHPLTRQRFGRVAGSCGPENAVPCSVPGWTGFGWVSRTVLPGDRRGLPVPGRGCRRR